MSSGTGHSFPYAGKLERVLVTLAERRAATQGDAGPDVQNLLARAALNKELSEDAIESVCRYLLEGSDAG